MTTDDNNSYSHHIVNAVLAAVFSVECCQHCPFYEYQDEMMDRACRASDDVVFGAWYSVDKWVDKRVHRNCPLKKGIIAVHIEKDS